MKSLSSEGNDYLKLNFFHYPQDIEKVKKFLENRRRELPQDVVEKTAKIIRDVRTKGDKALFYYTKKFDGFNLDKATLEVTEEELKEAFKNSEPAFIKALEIARERIFSFHDRFLQKTCLYEDELGCLLGQIVRPVERAGIYVPGGRANYPSSVLMNVIPAQVAGVKEIYVCVPPDKNGKISSSVLAALYLLKPNKVFRVGGAQAIAAMAYGTETIPKVDVISGPGNIYVAAAKKIVFGDVGIDMIAGPSEVAIVADENANPSWIARDLMAQAEHDPQASAFLISTSEKLLSAVEKELQKLVFQSQRAEIIKESLTKNGSFFLVNSIEDAFELVNLIAPEHLELEIENPLSLLNQVKTAGAVFLGNETAESFGDYILGPNHTLPTQGTARFSSPLSANNFVKVINVAMASPKAILELYPHLKEIAESEGLFEHEKAAYERFVARQQKK